MIKRNRARVYIYIDPSNFIDCKGIDKVNGKRVRCSQTADYTVDDFPLCRSHAKKRCLGIVRQANKRLRSESAALHQVRLMEVGS